jgi:hypothetical protein
MHLKSLQRPNADVPAFLAVSEYGEYAPTTGALIPSCPDWARTRDEPGGCPVATISDTSPIARRYGVKLVVGTGATWMLSLMFGAALAASSRDALND